MSEIALNEMRTEEEQIAAIKNWWSTHGIQLVVGVIVVALGYFGYQAWLSEHEKQGIEAGQLYLQLQDTVIASSGVQGALSESDLEQVRTISYLADQLQEDYAKNGYAVLGALAAARAAADRDDYAEAVKRLEWAEQAEQDKAGKQMIIYRLALLKAAMGQEQDALSLLSGADEFYATLYAEARGDIYRQMGDTASAADEYKLAVEKLLPAQASYGPALEFKLADVAAGLSALNAKKSQE